jgi:hypothetical protein
MLSPIRPQRVLVFPCRHKEIFGVSNSTLLDNNKCNIYYSICMYKNTNYCTIPRTNWAHLCLYLPKVFRNDSNKKIYIYIFCCPSEWWVPQKLHYTLMGKWENDGQALSKCCCENNSFPGALRDVWTMFWEPPV